MFRFSIRELMLVTLVVGLVAGWVIDHSRQSLSKREQEQKQEFAKWQVAALTDYIEKKVSGKSADERTYSVQVSEAGKTVDVESKFPSGRSTATYYFPHAP